MRRLITLNVEGRLSLRAANGDETEALRSRPNVLLLIDTSGSMAGAKLQQARNGAVEFTRSAVNQGYSAALAVFAERAAMVCDPTAELKVFEKKITVLRVGIVGATTDLAAGLNLANKFRELSTVVVITDGATPKSAALKAASLLKQRSIEIICIGTDDADHAFLEQLATRTELAVHVPSVYLANAITGASKLLRGLGSGR
jgi:Mg-chelatase subunit ChlD